MSFLTQPTGKVSAANSNNALSTAAYSAHTGLATAGTATTITLAAGASAVDSAYNNLAIVIVAGTGQSQVRLVTAYVGATRVATVAAWSTTPDATSRYVIHRNSGQAEDTSRNTITLQASTASATNDFYKHALVRVLDGDGAGQIRLVTGYDAATRVLSVYPNWVTIPSAASRYAVVGEGGAAQGGGATTITLSAAASAVDSYYNGLVVAVHSGTGAGQSRVITGYVGATRVATVAAWDVAPAAADEYAVFGGWAGAFEDVVAYAQTSVMVAIDAAAGQSMALVLCLSADSAGANHRVKISEVADQRSAARTLSVVSNYFRAYAVGLGVALTGALQTIHHTHKSKALTSSVSELISDSNDVELTRSVITGRTVGGQYQNVVVNAEGHINMALTSPISAFGALLQVPETVVVELSFIYGINSQKAESFLSPGFVVTVNTAGSAGTALNQSLFIPAAATLAASGAGTYFFLNSANDATVYYVWFNVSGGNTDPAPGGTGVQVSVTAGSSASAVAAAVAAAVDALGDFGAVVALGNVVTVTNAANGAASSARRGTMPASSGSTVAVSNSVMAATNSGGVGDYAVLRSKRGIRYSPGQGASARFTAVFDTPTAGTTQWAGVGNAVSALYFGYAAGTTFGITRRQSATLAVRTLTVTTGAGGAETATVTLDGATFVVALAAGTAENTAYQLAQGVYSAGRWRAAAVAATVIFLSDSVGPRAGAYSLASTGAAAGTFAATTAGVAAVDVTTPQTQWNVDQCDGFGPSGFRLNPQVGNVYKITWQWLGFGAISYYVENPTTGQWLLVHRERYSGTSVVPSLSIPHMGLTWVAASTTSTTPVTVRGVCGAAFLEGSATRQGIKFAMNAQRVTSSAAETVLLTLRNPDVFNGIPNRVDASLLTLSLYNDAGKGARIFIYLNAVLNTTAYQYVNSGNSCMHLDTTAATRTNGIKITEYVLPAASGQNINLRDLEIVLQQNDTITISIQRITTTNVDISASIGWIEYT